MYKVISVFYNTILTIFFLPRIHQHPLQEHVASPVSKKKHSGGLEKCFPIDFDLRSQSTPLKKSVKTQHEVMLPEVKTQKKSFESVPTTSNISRSSTKLKDGGASFKEMSNKRKFNFFVL